MQADITLGLYLSWEGDVDYSGEYFLCPSNLQLSYPAQGYYGFTKGGMVTRSVLVEDTCTKQQFYRRRDLGCPNGRRRPHPEEVAYQIDIPGI